MATTQSPQCLLWFSKRTQLAAGLALTLLVPLSAADPPTGARKVPTINKGWFGVGDVVMSILPLDAFRKSHGDTGKVKMWFVCDGQTDLTGTPLHAIMNKTPDFRGRYPRGFQESVPDLLVGQDGRPGTTIDWVIGRHSHITDIAVQGFEGGGDETGPVANQEPPNHRQFPSSAAGGTENRPNSVIVYFYIKAR